MNIIKLNAIDSTNEFLKKLKRDSHLPDFTVVTTDYQFNGKGQMGTSWVSDAGKNLTLSVLKRFNKYEIAKSFYINMAVSIAVYKLCAFYLPDAKVAIKWPNDILSGKNKLAGILIENTIHENLIVDSIIGIGLNVNQNTFSSNITRVTSLSLELKSESNLDTLLDNFLKILEVQLLRVVSSDFKDIKSEYESLLYKNEIPTMFKDSRNTIFLGKIIGVSNAGKLLVELENQEIISFNLKEITML